MARAVILSFNSNSAAEQFVRTVAEHNTVLADVRGDSRYNEELESVNATVEAVIAIPTKGCECDKHVDRAPTGRRKRKSSKREHAWTRGRRYGWMLCIACNRPAKPVVRHWITGMLNGANDLLPAILGTGPALPAAARYWREGGTGTQPEIKVGAHYEHL